MVLQSRFDTPSCQYPTRTALWHAWRAWMEGACKMAENIHLSFSPPFVFSPKWGNCASEVELLVTVAVSSDLRIAFRVNKKGARSIPGSRRMAVLLVKLPEFHENPPASATVFRQNCKYRTCYNKPTSGDFILTIFTMGL